MSRILAAVVFGSAFAVCAEAADSSPIGNTIDDFTLSDYRGKQHKLSDFRDSRCVVIAFLGTECPLAKLYAPRLIQLADEYGPQGAAFLGINANRQDSITEIAAYASRHGITFPVLKDLGNKVADQMGAVRTPEVFLLDADRVVRYWGRIDDQYGVGYIRDSVTRRDLAVALDQSLAGRPVEKPEIRSVGCYIGRVREPKRDAPITYSNQIARIFQNRCVECHREGEIAPFALTNYEEVAGWAETIAEVVRDERMPPWHAARQHGTFANDRRLPEEEKQLIYQWVADAAPQGDPAELPEPKTYLTGWQLARQPNLVIPMRDEPYTVQAEGEVKYQYFKVDPGFTEDKWIEVAEVVPGNRAVVHHILVFVRGPGQRGRGQGFLAAYVPGLRAKPWPAGMAKLAPAGSELIFQVHYTPIGSRQTDLSHLGLVFAEPDKITHIVKILEAIEEGFEIPPRDPNHPVEAESPPFDFDMQLISMSPHMNLRGKSFSYRAMYPDGRTKTLLDVPRYDFNWQTSYRLAELEDLPAGTVLHCVAHYDNSEDNLVNPDPTATVRWGDQTWEEMMIGFFDVAVPVTAEQRARGAFPDFRPSIEWQAERLLVRFDKDDNGEITRGEVPLKWQLIFLRMDADSDGTLTGEEIAASIRARQNRD